MHWQFGMASALETLCGQAYGARQYQKLGAYTYGAIISLLLVCLPISILWTYIEKLLILLGQDPLISAEACKFSVWLIPALFPYAILQLITRYLLSQSLVLPMLWSSVVALVIHVPMCWSLVFRFGFGTAGAAIAIGISYTLNVSFLGIYMYHSKACEKTHVTSSGDVLTSIKEFFRFAIPSAVMICLEWWSYEIVVLLSGLLPNPQLETSVLSICCKKALLVASTLGAVEVIIAITTLLCSRSVLGYAFGNDEELVDYVKDITLLLCFTMFTDTIQVILQGVARGTGWQHIGAYINLGSYYLAGIPMALILGFVVHLGGKGLWGGLITGSIMQCILLTLVTCSTNWEKQVTKARKRFVVMEEGLLLTEKQPLEWKVAVTNEVKKTCYIALPMVVVTVSQNLLQVASMSMVGHLGELELAGTAVATSLTNVTGFSLLFGMASALETLCGQAYGARQYQKLGAYTYGAIISLLLVCLPISFLWIYSEKLLILLGQDPLISTEACKFSVWLIPALFPYAILQLITRYLLSQSLVLPMLWSSVVALLIHVPTCWSLVFWFGFGTAGAALAIGISYTLNVIFLGIYMYQSKACEKTRVTCSGDVLTSIKEFFRLAIPSAVMICLEWWSYEIVVLLSGLLPNPQLETSVLSICLTVSMSHYFIPYSFGAAASTRISNELGAGNPQAAKMALLVGSTLGAVEVIITITTLLCSRSVLGYAFGNDEELVDYVKDITLLLCFTMFSDTITAILQGVARGTGWQHIGAYINLGSYYLAGIPMALILGFVVHLRGKGLWGGLFTGSIMQCILLTLVTCSTNWEKQATKARERGLTKPTTSVLLIIFQSPNNMRGRIDSIITNKAEEETGAKEAKESSYEGADNIIGKENGSKKEKNKQPKVGPTRVEPKPQ
ncbi:protein transparent testa 12 [Tanacetum coccineum]|uniref:Protein DETOXIFICATION n=1 Tax=Tanacetum coccineum TaxID=301880 RepID=A0ABQ4YP51_9ASTR